MGLGPDPNTFIEVEWIRAPYMTVAAAISRGRCSFDADERGRAVETIRETATERFVSYHRMLEDDPRAFIVLADQHPAGTGSGQTFVGRMAGIEAAGVRVDSG